MKNILTLTAAGVALLATPAMACNLAGSKGHVTPGTFGINETTNPVEIANKLITHPTYQTVMAACTKEQVLKSLATLNNWNDPNASIAPDFRFQIPLMVTPTPKPAMVSVPVVQAVPVVASAPAVTTPTTDAATTASQPVLQSPEITRQQNRLTEIERELKVRRLDASSQNRGLTSDEKALKNQLQSEMVAIRSDIADLQRQLALKADKSYVDENFATKGELNSFEDRLAIVEGQLAGQQPAKVSPEGSTAQGEESWLGSLTSSSLSAVILFALGLVVLGLIFRKVFSPRKFA